MDGIDYEWIGINVEKPPFDDLKVRQAIRYGIDVDAIIAGAYSGTVPRAKTLLAPQLLGHWAEAPVYQYDPAKAKALLEEAGKPSFDCTLTCLNDATTQATAQIVQANLAEIGVTVTINALDGGRLLGHGRGRQEQGPGADHHPLLLEVRSQLPDPVVRLVRAGRHLELAALEERRSSTSCTRRPASITDNAKRAEKYIRMQQLLDESATCIWITHGVHDFAHAKWLSPAILPNGNNWQFRFFKEA